MIIYLIDFEDCIDYQMTNIKLVIYKSLILVRRSSADNWDMSLT